MNLAQQLESAGTKYAKDMQKGGVMLAKVTNINDPDTLGRVKCKPVSTDPDVAETDWCFVMAPAGGNGYGTFFFPNVDDLVIVAFLNGNIHQPLVLGSYWAGETKAPYKIESGKNEIISTKTPLGSEIRLEDVKDKTKITITTPSGAVIQIDDENQTITAGDTDKKNQLLLNWKEGSVELKAEKTLTIAAGDTTLTMESSGNVTVKSSKKIGLESADIAMKGNSSFKAEAATGEISASGKLSLTASGVAELKGGMVQIN